MKQAIQARLKKIQSVLIKAGVKNPTLAQCKKLIERESDKSYKPTISHYRDMKNPRKLTKSFVEQQLEKYNQTFNESYSLENTHGYYEIYDGVNRLSSVGSLQTVYKAFLAEIKKHGYRLELQKKNPKVKTTRKNPSDLVVMLVKKIDRTASGVLPVKRLTDTEKNLIKTNKSLFDISGDFTGNFVRVNFDNKQVRNILGYENGKTVKSVNPKRDILAPNKSILDLMFKINDNEDITLSDLNTKEIGIINKNPNFFHLYRSSTGLKVKVGISTWAKKQLSIFRNPLTKKPNFAAKDFTDYQKRQRRENAQMFQGNVSGAKTKLLASNITPKNLTRLGELKQMIVKVNGKKQAIKFDGEAYLVMDARRNLHCVGKDSRIENLKVVGNGLAELGDLLQIDYVTAKKHIENGKMVYYYHKLGEVTREHPKLMLDKDKFPHIINGNYDVWKEGIVN